MDTAFRDTVPKENIVVTEMCMQDRLLSFEGEKIYVYIIKMLGQTGWKVLMLLQLFFVFFSFYIFCFLVFLVFQNSFP